MQPDERADVPQISDEDIVASAPRVRHLLISRLESLWEPVRVALLRDKGEGDSLAPIDPRLLELGLRIVKEEAGIYGIAKPTRLPATEDEDEGMPAPVKRAAIMDRLEEIEDRLRNQQQGPS